MQGRGCVMAHGEDATGEPTNVSWPLLAVSGLCIAALVAAVWTWVAVIGAADSADDAETSIEQAQDQVAQAEAVAKEREVEVSLTDNDTFTVQSMLLHQGIADDLASVYLMAVASGCETDSDAAELVNQIPQEYIPQRLAEIEGWEKAIDPQAIEAMMEDCGE